MNEREVAEIFEIPLDIALNLDLYRQNLDNSRMFWEMIWQERRIWGATAGMLRCLAQRVNYLKDL